MKKILCLIDTIGIGGAERQMIGLAQLLNSRGYDIDFIVYHNNTFYAELVEHYHLKLTKLEVGNNPVSKLLAIRRYIKEKGGFDCVITYKTGPNEIGCLLKMMGMPFKLMVSERSSTRILSRKEKLKFFLYRYADFIVPNSYTQENFIKKTYPKLSARTKAITNFTDLSQFTADKPNNNTIQKIVLTTARISKAKNILNYLEAISILGKRSVTGVHFDWYGDVQKGEEEYGKFVFERIKELNLSEIVSFHPATSDIIKKYQECTVFCLPSIYEGFPNSICEAMSCGKPIICSKVCDNPFIVEEGGNALLFDETNVDDIADKMQIICSMSDDDLQKWGAKSREIAEKKFSMDSFVEKYISLIES